MISHECLAMYKGRVLVRGERFLYVSPHVLLRPFIANYTISFPTVETMPDEYTILPTASSTLVLSVTRHNILSSLRGTNTKVCPVGAHANKMELLLLIEFHPGGLFPFMKEDQSELLDSYVPMEDLDRTLKRELEEELLQSESAASLIDAVNRIFMKRLNRGLADTSASAIMNHIIRQQGNVGARELSSEFFYSEKHIRRLFLKQIGTSPKMFARIVRVNYALHLLRSKPGYFSVVALQAGFFDQSHFIRDFKLICGVTPQDYMRKMSVFYNDSFKM